MLISDEDRCSKLGHGTVTLRKGNTTFVVDAYVGRRPLLKAMILKLSLSVIFAAGKPGRRRSRCSCWTTTKDRCSKPGHGMARTLRQTAVGEKDVVADALLGGGLLLKASRSRDGQDSPSDRCRGKGRCRRWSSRTKTRPLPKVTAHGTVSLRQGNKTFVVDGRRRQDRRRPKVSTRDGHSPSASL